MAKWISALASKLPSRVPMLYYILGTLILLSVVPMYFYSASVVSSNRERLKTNEMLLQNSVTRAVADEMTQRQITLAIMIRTLSSSVAISGGSDLEGDRVETPALQALLQKFVTSYDALAFATIVNLQAKGIQSGKIDSDPLLQREQEKGYAAAMQGRDFIGQPINLSSGRQNHTVLVMFSPLTDNQRIYGAIGIVLDLQFIQERLDKLSQGGLSAYIVDHDGRYVVGSLTGLSAGQDAKRFEIVRKFSEQKLSGAFSETSEFNAREGNMLGTFSPVPSLGWAVIAQKEQRDAYASVREMQRSSRLLALLAILVSVALSIFAARHITGPIELLTESSRAIAGGDFTQRVQIKSRTEIGELAETFNHMSADLERYVRDLRQSAQETRLLFMNSIKMLAGAVDEKDPYTRGHSDRVTKISVLLANEMGLPEAEIDKVRIAALLHDVGKIGIEDAVLKKPAALTAAEFEVMKTHTVKGANILRPVAQLAEIIPGIELHHESLDGNGYPYGLSGSQIPMMARIITVADTFDAMTTNRPYQLARPLQLVVEHIRSLAGVKFDPLVVAALESVVAKGLIRLHKAAPKAQ